MARSVRRRKKSDTAYVGRHLWLPRSLVREEVIKSALTLSPPAPPKGKVKDIEAWTIVGDHIRVPRCFFDHQRLEEWFGEDIRYMPNELAAVDGFNPELFTEGQDIVPRDESQARAMEALRLSSGGVLELGCGKGKTVSMLAEVKAAKVPTLIVVNNSTLIDQWVGECERWLGVTPTIVRGPKREFSDLTIAMLHTLAQNPPTQEEADRFGIVAFDECHHLSAPSFNQVCPMFRGDRYGLTATKRREDGLENLYLWHLGKVLYSDLTTELVPNVYFLKTGVHLTPEEIKAATTSTGMINVSLMRNILSTHPYRNQLILEEIRQARSNGRRILALGHIVSHLEYLAGEVEGSGLCVGKVSPKKRHKILKECDVIFGTTALAAEGLDAPWLDTLMILSPMKGKALFQQSLGRILRLHEGKKDPVAIVFEDKFKTARDMIRSLRKYLKDHNIPFESVEPE